MEAISRALVAGFMMRFDREPNIPIMWQNSNNIWYYWDWSWTFGVQLTIFGQGSRPERCFQRTEAKSIQSLYRPRTKKRTMFATVIYFANISTYLKLYLATMRILRCRCILKRWFLKVVKSLRKILLEVNKSGWKGSVEVRQTQGTLSSAGDADEWVNFATRLLELFNGRQS